MKPVEIYFAPKPDITLEELVEILRRTVFQSPGYPDGAYKYFPLQLQRHFEVR